MEWRLLQDCCNYLAKERYLVLRAFNEKNTQENKRFNYECCD